MISFKVTLTSKIHHGDGAERIRGEPDRGRDEKGKHGKGRRRDDGRQD